MNTGQLMTKEFFIKRFTDLCLKSGLPGFPKEDVNQHIILKSATLTFDRTAKYTEKEVNEKLDDWISIIGRIKNIDRITLRRSLVDAGYLTRNNDGSVYQVSPNGPRLKFFDETVDQINLVEVITFAREEIARRKREYLEKSEQERK